MQNVDNQKGVMLGISLRVFGLALFLTLPAAGQATQSKPASQQPAPAAGQAPPAGQQSPAPDQPPSNKEEDDAYTAFYGLTPTQNAEILAQGEAFLAKYPSSR